VQDVQRRIRGYEIVGQIGRGGMGIVHLARQSGLDRLVALKELAALDACDPVFARRFLHEARLGGSLDHPNIVAVFDYLEDGGRAFISMEYAERGSLRPLIGQLGTAQIGGVLEGVLSGLAHAETMGVVHRDLKPENILLSRRGAIKLADFGIARAANQTRLTETGMALGTPAYMAPEQATADEIGPWTDLYAAGMVAYELLVGRLPFGPRDTPGAILWKQVNEPLAPPLEVNPALDPRLAGWIEWLLAKEPARRPRGAEDALRSLADVLASVAGPSWRADSRLTWPRELEPVPPAGRPAGDESAPPPAASESEYVTYRG
jgi:serine/threonine protein kinase